MLNKFNNIQNKFSWLKIPNLMFYVVLITSILYFAELALKFNSKTVLISSILKFDSSLILKGELWRLFTYIFLMPKINFVLSFIYIYIINYVSNSLEALWGANKVTFYYIFGLICTTIAGFFTGTTNVVFLNLSLIFVFIEICSDVTVTLFSCLTLKLSWIGYLNSALFLTKLILSIFVFNLSNLVAEIVSILIFICFFGPRYFIDVFNRIKNFMTGIRM